MIDTNGTSDDSDSGATTHHVHYNPAERANLCETLVLTIADLADAEPLSLDPLYETVDPEILDDIVESGGTLGLDGSVSFTYAGHRVQVHASGLLEITPVGE